MSASRFYFLSLTVLFLSVFTKFSIADEPIPQNLINILQNETVALPELTNPDDALMDETEDDLDPEDAQARAAITATQSDLTVAGEALFYQDEDGLTVKVLVANVPNPGAHGIHIHENGSCADNGTAAGSHFNPQHAQHGFYPKDGVQAAHSGDMGNIDIAADGNGALVIKMPGLFLKDADNPVLGKAIILHEKVDDFGQPTGNAGGRIGCGIIVEQL